MIEKYYTILELEFPASRDEIKKAFRRLAHIHHPDKGGDQEKFKKISEAYHVLIQRGYWEALADEQQKREAKRPSYQSTPHRSKASDFNVFFTDDGTEFWMQDHEGYVSYYWKADQTTFDASSWQDDDDSSASKDYADMSPRKLYDRPDLRKLS